jgi:hypothetical protein
MKPLRTDSSKAFGILYSTIKQKRSTSIDTRHHWLTDKIRQKQFDFYWRPYHENLGDYHTKHHSAQHHKYMHIVILNKANNLHVLRGCVKLLHSRPYTHTDTHTYHYTQRATQQLGALARAYCVTI